MNKNTITEIDILDGMKNDEFVFYYQPKVSLISGKVCGAEALIRWLKPDGSLIPPNAFIPLAEQSSLINDITLHMLPKLIKDQLVLMDLVGLTTSFNASAKDFEDEAFCNLLLASLNKAKLPFNSIEIELTETAALESSEKIRSQISPLREAGVSLSMDDFGKGYSSIDTLSLLPFNVIKLDQSIIERMLSSKKVQTIIESTIRMAHELGIDVVAEGVESVDQYNHLLECGCTKVQGFWISKAIPLDEYIAFVKKNERWSGVPVGLIHMAIIDHIQWRKQLVSELVSLATLPHDAPNRKQLLLTPLSCFECKLGHWYYGFGKRFCNLSSYQAIGEPHQKLHALGDHLAKLVKDGAGMVELTPYLRRLSESSLAVLSCLQELADDGLIDMHLEKPYKP